MSLTCLTDQMVNTRSGSGVDQPLVQRRRRGSNSNPPSQQHEQPEQPQPGATTTATGRDGAVPHCTDTTIDQHGCHNGQYAGVIARS